MLMKINQLNLGNFYKFIYFRPDQKINQRNPKRMSLITQKISEKK